MKVKIKEKTTKSGVDLKQLKHWLSKHVGTKCKYYAIGCINCQAWRMYEDLKQLLKF